MITLVAIFLALIITLDAGAEGFETIRKICLQITINTLNPKTEFRNFQTTLPEFINTWFGQRPIKAVHNRVSVNSNTDGSIATIITDKQEKFGLGNGLNIIDVEFELFRNHNYSKYVSILCEIDDITASLAGLQLRWTGTIANGAKT